MCGARWKRSPRRGPRAPMPPPPPHLELGRVHVLQHAGPAGSRRSASRRSTQRRRAGRGPQRRTRPHPVRAASVAPEGSPEGKRLSDPIVTGRHRQHLPRLRRCCWDGTVQLRGNHHAGEPEPRGSAGRRHGAVRSCRQGDRQGTRGTCATRHPESLLRPRVPPAGTGGPPPVASSGLQVESPSLSKEGNPRTYFFLSSSTNMDLQVEPPS